MIYHPLNNLNKLLSRKTDSPYFEENYVRLAR